MSVLHHLRWVLLRCLHALLVPLAQVLALRVRRWPGGVCEAPAANERLGNAEADHLGSDV